MAFSTGYRRKYVTREVENYLIEILKTYTSPSGTTVCKGSRLFINTKMALLMIKCGLGKRVKGLESQFVTEQEVMYTSK